MKAIFRTRYIKNVKMDVTCLSTQAFNSAFCLDCMESLVDFHTNKCLSQSAGSSS